MNDMELVHYEAGRKLRDTLMGEARHGKAWFRPRQSINRSTRPTTAPTSSNPSTNPSTNQSIDLSNTQVGEVLIKSFSRACVNNRCTLTGQSINENPKTELTLHTKLCDRDSYAHLLINPPINQSLLLRLAQSNSRYIVHLWDVGSDQSTIYAIMEFCSGGELFQYISSHSNPSMHQSINTRLLESKIFFVQLLLGLSCLHSLRIAHRDLSLENLLLTSQLELRIADFGLAWEMPQQQINNQATNQSIRDLTQGALIDDRVAVGKIRYMSPEMFSCHPYNPFSVDMWACGVILFVLINQCFPFNFPHSTDTLFVLICSGRINDVLKGWRKTPFDESLIDLFSHLFCPEHKRWGIEECLNSTFLHDTWKGYATTSTTNQSTNNQSIHQSSNNQIHQSNGLSRHSSASSTSTHLPHTSPQSAPATFHSTSINQSNHQSNQFNHQTTNQSTHRSSNHHHINNSTINQSMDHNPFSLDESLPKRSISSNAVSPFISIDQSIYRSVGSINPSSINQSIHTRVGLKDRPSLSYPDANDVYRVSRLPLPSPPPIQR